ncbi:g13506 [Coccomyxa viridis]|uniref:G13506 protein n=1 Tax=Coccomyxa viridis TaxID=1274662 RepID=A0ABP1GFG3_9CHLO
MRVFGRCGLHSSPKLITPSAIPLSPAAAALRGPPVCQKHPPTILQCWQGRGLHEQQARSIAARAAALDQEVLEGEGGLLEGQGRLVQWYPGHIARAERRLQEQLSQVDAVLEVRDARIPLSTCHSQIAKWCGNKPRVLVLNRVDMVSERDKASWTRHFNAAGTHVCWTDGVSGLGTGQVKKAAMEASAEINARRKNRGLKPRPVRAVVIGFPNVGKSALINRLLNRRVCDSAPKPGVTRNLKWLRLGGDLDLLDAPGVIPASFSDQLAAQRLAMCNDIGEASYIDSFIAASLLQVLRELPSFPAIDERLKLRFKFPLEPSMTGEDYVNQLGDDLFQGDVERAGQRILRDFRNMAFGRVALELPERLW